MKSEDVQFTVLKRLALLNDYGYNLIKHEEFEGIDKSQFYKILRKMKDENLIEIIDTEQETGKPREILGITEKGRKKYINRTIDSAKYFMSLIREIMIDFMGEMIITQFSHWNLDYIFDSCKEVLLDLSYSLENQLALLNAVGDSFNTNHVIYLIAKKEEIEKKSGKEKIDAEMHYLEENVILRPESLDLIISVSDITEEKLTGPRGLIDMLRKDGTLILITISDETRASSVQSSMRIYNLLKRKIDDEVANDLTQRFSSLFMPDNIMDMPENRLQSDQIAEIMSNKFQEYEPLSDFIGFQKMETPPIIVHHGKKKL